MISFQFFGENFFLNFSDPPPQLTPTQILNRLPKNAIKDENISFRVLSFKQNPLWLLLNFYGLFDKTLESP